MYYHALNMGNSHFWKSHFLLWLMWPFFSPPHPLKRQTPPRPREDVDPAWKLEFPLAEEPEAHRARVQLICRAVAAHWGYWWS